MNETLKEHDDLNAAPQPPELSSPHFDETAIAVAQPVELLPDRMSAARPIFSSLSASLKLIIAFAALLLATVSVTAVVLVEWRHEPTANPAGAENTPASQPAQDEGSAAAVEESEKTRVVTPRHQKTKARSHGVSAQSGSQDRTAETIGDDESKPAPRKIGEIRYTRSPERP